MGESGVAATTAAPHRVPVDAVLSALATDGRTGLSGADARARLERHGRNELQAKPRTPAWKRFLAQFKSVLVLLLLVATAISATLWLVERDSALPYEAIAILAVVLLNAGSASSRRRARRRPWRRFGRCPPRRPTSCATGGATESRRPRSCRATSSSSRRATPFPPTPGSSARRRCRRRRARSPARACPSSKDAQPIAEDVGVGRPPQHGLQRNGGDQPAAAAPSWSRPACARRWAASPGCSREPRPRRRPCRSSSTASAGCSVSPSWPSRW